VSSFCFST